MINLAAQSKSMIIVTFGQKCLIKCNYFVCKDAKPIADDGERKKVSIFCLDYSE